MWAKISTFAIFELHQRNIPQKNTFFIQNSITNSKCKVCFNKSERNKFSRFWVKTEDDLLYLVLHFSNVCQGISKMTSQNLVKRFEIKSHQRRDLWLTPARAGGSKTGSGGGRHHLPTLLGLMHWRNSGVSI